MAQIRGTGNKQTELRLAKILRRNRIAGWRRHQRIQGRPDFIFRSEKVAIFVDGCFWHGCPLHGRKPDSNQTYWLPKLERTKRRDRRNTRRLRAGGWCVVRLWDHDLNDEGRVVRRLVRALARSMEINAPIQYGSPVRKRRKEAGRRER